MNGIEERANQFEVHEVPEGGASGENSYLDLTIRAKTVRREGGNHQTFDFGEMEVPESEDKFHRTDPTLSLQSNPVEDEFVSFSVMQEEYVKSLEIMTIFHENLALIMRDVFLALWGLVLISLYGDISKVTLTFLAGIVFLFKGTLMVIYLIFGRFLARILEFRPGSKLDLLASVGLAGAGLATCLSGYNLTLATLGGHSAVLGLLAGCRARKSPSFSFGYLAGQQIVFLLGAGLSAWFGESAAFERYGEIGFRCLQIVLFFLLIPSFWFLIMKVLETCCGFYPIGALLFGISWMAASLTLALGSLLAFELFTGCQGGLGLEWAVFIHKVCVIFVSFWILYQNLLYWELSRQKNSNQFEAQKNVLKIKRKIPFFMAKATSRNFFKRISPNQKKILEKAKTETTEPQDPALDLKVVDTICLEVDGVLATVHTFSHRPKTEKNRKNPEQNLIQFSKNICKTQRAAQDKASKQTREKPPIPVKQAQDPENLCLVCFENPSEIVIMECGHSDVCKPCAMDIWRSSNKCFICQENISYYLVVAAQSPGVVRVLQTLYLKQ